MRSGLIALERTPSAPCSSAYCRIRASSAALAAPYAPKSGPGLSACLEALNNRTPPRRWALNTATTARARFWWAKRLSSKLCLKSASCRVAIAPATAEPALEISTSTPAESPDHEGDGAVHGLWVGDVALDGAGGGSNGMRDLVGGVAVDVEQGDGGAFAGEGA